MGPKRTKKKAVTSKLGNSSSSEEHEPRRTRSRATKRTQPSDEYDGDVENTSSGSHSDASMKSDIQHSELPREVLSPSSANRSNKTTASSDHHAISKQKQPREEKVPKKRKPTAAERDSSFPFAEQASKRKKDPHQIDIQQRPFLGERANRGDSRKPGERQRSSFGDVKRSGSGGSVLFDSGIGLSPADAVIRPTPADHPGQKRGATRPMPTSTPLVDPKRTSSSSLADSSCFGFDCLDTAAPLVSPVLRVRPGSPMDLGESPPTWQGTNDEAFTSQDSIEILPPNPAVKVYGPESLKKATKGKGTKKKKVPTATLR